MKFPFTAKTEFDVHEITLKKLEIKAKFTNWGRHVNLCISMNEKSVCC